MVAPGSARAQASPPPFALPATLTVTVSGRPAEGSYVTRAIVRAVRQAVVAAIPPGTTYSIGDVTPALGAIGPGFQTGVIVPFAVYNAADPQTPFEGTLNVTVRNEDPGDFASRWLYFDDDPEHVAAEGATMRASVDLNFPCRVYYYHQNKGDARRFLFMLTSSEPARVQIVDSIAGPSQDVLSVGHAGSLNFLLGKLANQGTIIDLEPGVPYVLHETAARDNDVVNGIADVRVLAGTRIKLTVAALATDTGVPAALAGARLPGDGHHRYGTFSLDAYGTYRLDFQAGGADAAVTYGDREPTAPNVVPGDPGRDIGDYGIIQRITLRAANPAAEPADVTLFEQPHGGPVRSSFIVDGATIELGCARVPQRYRIASYTLAPNETRTIEVLTMTDGGSSYPLTVGLTSGPVVATPPPISAPDGCFPKP
jgi:hypothetical protein